MNSMSDLCKWDPKYDYYQDAKKQLAALTDFLGFVDTMLLWETMAFSTTGRIYIILRAVSRKLWGQMLRVRAISFVKDFPYNQGFISGKFAAEDFVTWTPDECVTISVYSLRLAHLLQEGTI